MQLIIIKAKSKITIIIKKIIQQQQHLSLNKFEINTTRIIMKKCRTLINNHRLLQLFNNNRVDNQLKQIQ